LQLAEHREIEERKKEMKNIAKSFILLHFSNKQHPV